MGLDFLEGVLVFLALIPSVVFHEVAHGYVAYLLGDPTAKRAGRLSLNPIRHVDPVGTLLLPGLIALARLAGMNLAAFGWAKPVPINPYFFRDYRRGMLLTGLAGPSTNLLLATVAGLAYRFLAPLPAMQTGPALIVMLYLIMLTQVNLVLMFFNLIPIPPFDGSRVLPIFLSDNAMRVYAKVEQYGFLILIVLLFMFEGVIGAYFNLTVNPLMRLIVGG